MIRALAILVALSVAALGGAQTPAPTSASPELVGALAKEMGSTPQQAEGAAGAIFGVAKSRLKPEEFSKLSSAVPGMDSLLKAAPAMGAASALPGGAGAALGGVSALAGPFSKLGLKPEMAMKAVPVVTNYVTKSGGAEVGKLLGSVFK